MMEKVDILVVVDMQNDFVTGALGTPEAQAIVPKVVEKIKNWKVRYSTQWTLIMKIILILRRASISLLFIALKEQTDGS